MNFVTIPGSLGAASSESAAGSGRLRAPAAVHAAVESAAVSAVAWSSRGGRAGVSLGSDGCEVRLCDPCARVRPCVPCVRTRIHIHNRVCPVCVPALPPGVFYSFLWSTLGQSVWFHHTTPALERPRGRLEGYCTVCALHDVSPRDRWMCVLPGWQMNVNVHVNVWRATCEAFARCDRLRLGVL